MGPSCNIGCGFLIRRTIRGRTTIDPRAIQPRLPPAYRKRFILSTRLHKLSKSRYLLPCPPNIPGQLCQIAPRPDSATNQRRSRQNNTVRNRQPHEPEIHIKRRTWMRWSASVAFECFSQRMCLTLTAVAAFIPLPCQQGLQISIQQKGYSMFVPFPPCLPSLRHSPCPSRRSSSCLWRLRPLPLVWIVKIVTEFGQWAPIGLTGFTLINATWAGHCYGKCGPDGQAVETTVDLCVYSFPSWPTK
jgi:hypothetical protein